MPDPYTRPPSASHPAAPTRPTVYQRIMRAAAGGHGLTLTPDEVATLSASEAIQQAAAKDNGETWR